MSIYKSFSLNLRKQCERYDSIAEVCKNTGINRQQFNRYLSAKSLPNAKTLAKLCDFFGIEEEELFLVANTNATQERKKGNARENTRSISDQIDYIFNSLPKSTINSLNFSNVLLSGYYVCYFPLQNIQGYLVRSLIKTKTVGSVTLFCRRTRFTSPSNPKESIMMAKHVGIVFADQDTIYMIGQNRLEPQNVSLLSFEKRRIGGQEILAGLALSQGFNRQYSCRTCMEWLGKSIIPAKSALRTIGIVSAKDDDIHPVISSLLTPNRFGIEGQTSIPLAEQLLVAAP